MGNEPAIRLDIAPVNTVQSRRQDYEALLLEHATDTPLSSLVNPLVMDETGLILPLSYRINPNIALGCLDSKIVDLITRYKQVEWKKLRTPLELSFTALETREENFVDWFFHVVKMSYTLSEQQ